MVLVSIWVCLREDQGGPGRELQPSRSLKSLGRRVRKAKLFSGADRLRNYARFCGIFDSAVRELYGLIMYLSLSAVPNSAIMAK